LWVVLPTSPTQFVVNVHKLLILAPFTYKTEGSLRLPES
jgi:hypothetical protein